ncbi:MAG: hypothetical protein SGILL_006883 [Bacillariaceae sp.]
MNNRRQATNDDLFWGTKVIRRRVDPITFAFQEDVVGIPRIEETSFETTDFAVSQKGMLRLKHTVRGSSEKNGSSTLTSPKKRSNVRNGRKPSTPAADPQRRSVSMPLVNSSSSAKKKSSRSKSPKGRGASNGSSATKSKQSRLKKAPTAKKQSKTSSDSTLGSFLQRNTAQQFFQQEAKRVLGGGGGLYDNRSVGSGRSMATMSVTDRSIAERSKTEASLAQRAKQRRVAREERAKRRRASRERRAATAKLQEKQKVPSEGDIKEENEDEVENENQVAPQLSSKKPLTGILRKGSLEDSLNLEDAVVSREEKKLRFRDEHSEKYISKELTNSMYDELFWTAEELAEFRYEAFMEEAGLDVNDFD